MPTFNPHPQTPVRFYKEEEKNDPEFAKKLAANADLYVNDAFGTAHRAHGSTEGALRCVRGRRLLCVHVYAVDPDPPDRHDGGWD